VKNINHNWPEKARKAREAREKRDVNRQLATITTTAATTKKETENCNQNSISCNANFIY